jgi:hypothetical protein
VRRWRPLGRSDCRGCAPYDEKCKRVGTYIGEGCVHLLERVAAPTVGMHLEERAGLSAAGPPKQPCCLSVLLSDLSMLDRTLYISNHLLYPAATCFSVVLLFAACTCLVACRSGANLLPKADYCLVRHHLLQKKLRRILIPRPQRHERGRAAHHRAAEAYSEWHSRPCSPRLVHAKVTLFRMNWCAETLWRASPGPSLPGPHATSCLCLGAGPDTQHLRAGTC